MSGIVVGDSKPLSMNDMVLCQRIEYHVDGSEKSLPVLRESVKPGTDIHFQLTIDTDICKLNIEEIKKAIVCFNKMYYKVFTSKFPKIEKPQENTVWLGGGVGFVSKTEVYPLLGEERGLLQTVKIFNDLDVERKHGHHADRRLGVSPHICKVAYYNKRRYEIGRANIVFKAIL